MEKGSSAWKALNVLRSKAKDLNGPPVKLLLNGKPETNPLKLASAMNQYFINKINKLKEEMKTACATEDPVDFMTKHLPDNIKKLDLELVSRKEVVTAISNLKNSHSVGPDGISNWLMKSASEALAAPLESLFNLSISSAVYPSAWKKAEVIPLWKKKSQLDPSSYRPVSLTSKPSLLFEKIKYIKTPCEVLPTRLSQLQTSIII